MKAKAFWLEHTLEHCEEITFPGVLFYESGMEIGEPRLVLVYMREIPDNLDSRSFRENYAKIGRMKAGGRVSCEIRATPIRFDVSTCGTDVADR